VPRSCPLAVSPPLYRTRLPGGSLIPMRRDPLRFLRGLAREHGDVVRYRLGPQELWLVNDPELIQSILVTNDRRFMKGRGLQVAARLLGQGLLTSEGEFHRRQRRLAQPAFHRPRVEAYGQVMVEYARETADRWRDGAEVDVAREMQRLTLRIAAKTLFDTSVESEAEAIHAALTESMRLFQWGMLPYSETIERLVPALPRRFEQARGKLDAAIGRMIRERRASGEDRGDLLSMLLLAQDEEAGGGMTDEQVRDETLTILLAGHETTANALAWTWYLLAQYPEVEARMHAEVREVLGGRPPTVADVPQLPYTRRVLAESMRLYPPAWTIARRAVEDCPLGPYVIGTGKVAMMSQWVTHHDPRFFPDPFRFDPERWTPEAQAARPKFSYYPFGGGSRLCIGEAFAWMEGVLVLATLAQGWQMRLVPGHRVVPQPLITLRPRNGVRVRLHQHTNGG
jgi:cytochrome P450